jgi:NAD+ kinase
MNGPFQTIALCGKPDSEGVARTLNDIAAILVQRGHQVLFESGSAASAPPPRDRIADLARIGREANLAIIVGGDGTMLGIARALAPDGVPLIGINFGRLGFITDIPLREWGLALGAVLDGQYHSEERALLQARVLRGEQCIYEATALNDVVVCRSSRAGMIDIKVEVDGQFMYGQRADGLIVATPTGSTAYALSCSGPILYPTLAGLVLVPVAPQALSNRPIVLPASSVIRMVVADGRQPRVNCDMQSFADLHVGDIIEVRQAPYSARFLHPVGYSYFATLRSKLNWHEVPGLEPAK